MIDSTIASVALVLRYDDPGSYSCSNIKISADTGKDAELYALGMAINSLQVAPAKEICKVVYTRLTEMV